METQGMELFSAIAQGEYTLKDNAINKIRLSSDLGDELFTKASFEEIDVGGSLVDFREYDVIMMTEYNDPFEEVPDDRINIRLNGNELAIELTRKWEMDIEENVIASKRVTLTDYEVMAFQTVANGENTKLFTELAAGEYGIACPLDDSNLPSFGTDFNDKAYIDWELSNTSHELDNAIFERAGFEVEVEEGKLSTAKSIGDLESEFNDYGDEGLFVYITPYLSINEDGKAEIEAHLYLEGADELDCQIIPLSESEKAAFVAIANKQLESTGKTVEDYLNHARRDKELTLKEQLKKKAKDTVERE